MISHTAAAPRAAGQDLLAGAGEMARLVRSTDWSRTPLGPVASWPHSLRTAVSICLNSAFPIVLWWGPEMVMLYNDAYRPILGAKKHPGALGKRGRDCWPEIWDTIGPMLEGVLASGRPTWSENLVLPLERGGIAGESFFTFSYSPIPDDDGRVSGIFCAVTETTASVLTERRSALLRDLTERTGEAASADEVCVRIVEVLRDHSRDVPFALLYRVEADGRRARRIAAVGFPSDAIPGPAEQPLIDEPESAAPSGMQRWEDGPATADRSPEWPLAAVVEPRTMLEVNDLIARWGNLPGGPWDEPARCAVVVSMGTAGEAHATFMLVAGVSSRHVLDDNHRGFLRLLANQLGAAMVNAEAHDLERQRTAALTELDRAKTAFFSNVSHEFRTPLTLLLGPIEDALLQPDLPGTARDKLEVAHRNSLRLLKLVNTLLDLSRVEAGRVQAWYEPTDLAAFTRDLVSTFGSAIDRGGLRLRLALDPLPEPVWVDREMWEKVVLNLASNAFKFTLEGEIEVSLHAEGGHAILRVRDSGIGIPEQELPHIFDRFHRVREARGRSYEGTGIGLALVQELVRLHAGTIVAESAPGEGALFIVRIPLGTAHLPADRVSTDATPRRSSTSAQSFVQEAIRWLPDTTDEHVAVRAQDEERGIGAEGGAGRAVAEGHVLVVDDNADMRAYVRDLLTPRYDVVAVADGEAALEAIRARRPDLVLSDVMMPRMNGLELLAALRTDASLDGLPIILLSARAGEEAASEGLALGADDYLVKPFSARELLARVDAHVRLHRLRREALRREQELRIETEDILASTDDPFVAVDAEWRVTYVNAAAERLAGRTRAEMLGVECWTGCAFLCEAASERELRRAMDTRVKARFELVDPETERTTEVRVHPLSSGGLALYAHDVSDQIRVQRQTAFLASINLDFARLSSAEEIMRVVADRIAQFLGVTSVSFAEIDEDAGEANVIFDHHAAGVRSVLGRHRLTDYMSPSYLEALTAGRPAVSNDVLADARLEGRAQAYLQYQVRSQVHAPFLRAGRWKFLLTVQRAEPYEWREDEVELVRDLSARIWPRLERARAEEALREADRRKDDFIATLAHELRNPLTPLHHGLEVLRLSGDNRETAERVQEMMERQVDIMRRLVDDLLEVSRITRGRIELRRRRVDLSSIIRSAIETSHPLIAGSGHEFLISLPPEPITLDADAVRLAQVFANLLNNAARYTNPGGQIWLTGRLEAEQIVVSVRDSGIGIPPEMLPRIFEMFTQVDRSPNRKRGGLGIGLALVRGLVEMHGGRVEARSAGPGQGSEFIVTLPIATGGAAADDPPERLTRMHSPVRVLVVDDNHDAADSLATLLHLSGADVRIAYDGPSALQVLSKFDATTVLLDIGMPGMDGYEVARKIRERPAWRDLTLIALTGWGQEQDRQRSHAAGFSHHLVKPVDINVLQSLLMPAPAAERTVAG